MVEVKNLVKTFKLPAEQVKKLGLADNVKRAVNGVSFNVNEGEIFGLLGPNGAGKTTVMRMLSTLIKPDSGDALFDGNSIVTSPEKVRGNIAFLTNELKLDGRSTANEMFEYFSDLYHLSKEQRKARKQELFTSFGITTFSDIAIEKLSQGMKQKLSIVISILHDPPVIIFDEPTNGLDIMTAKEVRDFILEMKKKKKSIIVSTHIFDLIEKTCDKVGFIIDGKLVYENYLKAIEEKGGLEDFFFDVYEKCKGNNGGEGL